MAKTKRLITITAGRLVHAVCYTQAMPYDNPPERGAKLKCSTAARRLMNFNCTWQKCQLKIAANFGRNDLYVTLTYDDAHLPPTRKQADALASKFLRQFRAVREAAGGILKYIRSTHELAGDDGRRLHHHIVVNAGTGDYELVRSLWGYGKNIEIKRIGQSELYNGDDFMELAKYLTCERHPDAPPTTIGVRCWSGSRNLEKPVRKSDLVDDSLTVEAPPGAFVLDTDERRNEYGTFKYIKYLLPERRAGKKSATHRRE